MNNLLPKLEDLEPIVDSRQTFSETPFIRDFYLLSDGDKLKIISDIVKQTMIYEETPNPQMERQELVGDDYTASQIFIEYLKSLNLYKRIELVLVPSKKNIDIRGFYDCHFSVLVEGNDNKTYLVDATPDIGYGIGEVNNLENRDLYNTYITIDDEMQKKIYVLRNDMYNIKHGIYSEDMIDNYKSLRILFNNEVFNGLLLKYYNCINNSNFTKLKRMVFLDFHDRVDCINDLYLKNEINKISIINSWYDSLKKATLDNRDFKEQQRLAQYICSELKNKRTIEIDGKIIDFNHITPRLLWEHGYNVVIIKPSAYLVGVQASAEKHVIPKSEDIVSFYNCNMGEKNSYGLRPMVFFHPHGIQYEFQMNGPNKVILVNEQAEKLNIRKHYVRDTMAQMIQNHFVNWFDGQKILWDTQLNTNLVHTTDDAAEASIHLLSCYPEYQSFTRFDYPNPVLRKKKGN